MKNIHQLESEYIERMEAEQAQNAKDYAYFKNLTPEENAKLKEYMDRSDHPPEKRGFINWLKALLPILLLLTMTTAYSGTTVIDQNGRVITSFPWPLDHDVTIPVVIPNILKELSIFQPPATPAPVYTSYRPMSTPRPL